MGKTLSLKEIDSTIYEHDGWGAGPGATINIEYECPCGKGKVIYEKEDTPGFRESSIDCTCMECKVKYTFNNGSAKEI